MPEVHKIVKGGNHAGQRRQKRALKSEKLFIIEHTMVGAVGSGIGYGIGYEKPPPRGRGSVCTV
jgi:hypothetical protein